MHGIEICGGFCGDVYPYVGEHMCFYEVRDYDLQKTDVMPHKFYGSRVLKDQLFSAPKHSGPSG